MASIICPICLELSPSCLTTFADAITLRSMLLIFSTAVSMSCSPRNAASAVSFEVFVTDFVFSDMFSMSLKTMSTFFFAEEMSLSWRLMLPLTSATFSEM